MHLVFTMRMVKGFPAIAIKGALGFRVSAVILHFDHRKLVFVFKLELRALEVLVASYLCISAKEG